MLSGIFVKGLLRLTPHGSLRLCSLFALAAVSFGVRAWSAEAPANEGSGGSTTNLLLRESAPNSIWDSGIGDGFRPGLESFTAGLAGAYGLKAFGGIEGHDLGLASVEFGRMVGPVLGDHYGLRGNFEARIELFSGAEFSPKREWLVGLTPHLRYDFATGTRWVPFIDAGAGISATSIGPPDLSGTFEFNLQAGMGVHRFLRDNLALTLETRVMHMSCAGLSNPNLGLNAVIGMLGITWFF